MRIFDIVRKLVAVLIFSIIAALTFAQGNSNSNNNSPKQQRQDFTEIQRTFKVDQLSFDDKNWKVIDPPKYVTVTSTTVTTPDQVLQIAAVVKATTGDYVVSFIGDPQIYVFDLRDGLIFVGTGPVFSFILHIQKSQIAPPPTTPII
jgi:hypothetical protein